MAFFKTLFGMETRVYLFNLLRSIPSQFQAAGASIFYHWMSCEYLCGNDAQADPKFKTLNMYTRMTGESLRSALADALSIPVDRLPVPGTLQRLMNRRKFPLRKVRTRDPNSQNAADHDMGDTPSLTPCGILEVDSGQLFLGMNPGTTTSDSIVDTLERWWHERQANYPNVRSLMIDLDNGPDVSSSRTQFIKRIIQFADRTGLQIELVYYPPYHSKYNSVERCWSALERHWNGAILRTIQDVIKWAETMTWKKLRPILWVQEADYQLGVTLSRTEMRSWSVRLKRMAGIERWSVTIEPDQMQT